MTNLCQHMQMVVIALCDDVGTPRSALVKELAIRGEFTELQKLRVLPSDYTTPDAFFRDAAVVDLLRKCDLETGVDKEKAAVDTFWLCERQNAATNARLNRFRPKHLFQEDSADDAIYNFIVEWRKEVRSLLGPLPEHLTARFGQGATYADTGDLKTVPDKMSSRPTITSRSTDTVIPFWEDTLWSRHLVRDRPWFSNPRLVRGNKFFTVPKDGLKHRGCGKEPSLNISYQLDIGRLLKQRLKRQGIDLYEGKAIHNRLAQAASVLGHLATVDLSNASDTVSRVLPEIILPEDWFLLLDSLRSPMTLIEGKWVYLEKFSSMGNGFTFELETIIFASIARTIARSAGLDPKDISCYGDDIIIPTQISRDVLAALRYFGFTPNEKKTFTEGPFRESCGGDYYHGVPVRPHYIESLPNEPQHWISLANGIRRMAFGDASNSDRWKYLRRAWRHCLAAIPTDIRGCRGPEHLGDIVIHDEAQTWNVKRDQSLGVASVRSYVPIPSVLPWAHWSPSVQLAAAILGYPPEGVTPRDGISGWKRTWTVYNRTCAWLPPKKELRLHDSSPDDKWYQLMFSLTAASKPLARVRTRVASF